MPSISQTQIYIHFIYLLVFNLANVFVFKNTLPRDSGYFVGFFYLCARNKDPGHCKGKTDQNNDLFRKKIIIM